MLKVGVRWRKRGVDFFLFYLFYFLLFFFPIGYLSVLYKQTQIEYSRFSQVPTFKNTFLGGGKTKTKKKKKNFHVKTVG